MLDYTSTATDARELTERVKNAQDKKEQKQSKKLTLPIAKSKIKEYFEE